MAKFVNVKVYSMYGNEQTRDEPLYINIEHITSIKGPNSSGLYSICGMPDDDNFLYWSSDHYINEEDFKKIMDASNNL